MKHSDQAETNASLPLSVVTSIKMQALARQISRALKDESDTRKKNCSFAYRFSRCIDIDFGSQSESEINSDPGQRGTGPVPDYASRLENGHRRLTGFATIYSLVFPIDVQKPYIGTCAHEKPPFIPRKLSIQFERQSRASARFIVVFTEVTAVRCIVSCQQSNAHVF